MNKLINLEIHPLTFKATRILIVLSVLPTPEVLICH